MKAANVSMVTTTTAATGKREESNPTMEWLACLIGQEGDKRLCLDKSANLIMNQATITAVLVLLSVSPLLLLSVVKYSADNPSVTAFGYCFSCHASRCTLAGTTWSGQKPSQVGSL